jgi:transcription elongation factor/antiterminator RfaH
MAEWYLVRTKAGEERRANEQLFRVADETLLPLMKVSVRRWSKLVEMIVPLFACYLFALFDVERDYNHVRHSRGVQYVVRNGDLPAVVPKWIIAELRARCAEGPIEITRRELLPGEPVRVVRGPFREFEGIFERNLSGSERVAILFSTMGAGARVVLPASMVVPVT